MKMRCPQSDMLTCCVAWLSLASQNEAESLESAVVVLEYFSVIVAVFLFYRGALELRLQCWALGATSLAAELYELCEG